VIKPMWPFWWMFTLENWIGLSGILYGGGALFTILVALPFIDRNPHRAWRHRRVAMTIASAIVAAIIVLTILMAFTTAKTHLGM